MDRLKRVRLPLLLAAGLSGSCVSVPRERAPAPPDRLAAERSWRNSRPGYVFRIAYFTEAELRDGRWEAGRREMMRQARFCRTGERIVRREVRWYQATAESGQRCAAVIYSVQCDIPTLVPTGSLEDDRIRLMRMDPERPIQPRCGEKDRARLPPSPPGSISTLADLFSPEASCATGESSTAEPLRVLPETRVHIRTLVDPRLADTPGNFNETIGRIPEARIYRVFADASLIEPQFRAAPVADDGVNILVTQEFALVRGEPYCVRLTARQGPRLWRRVIERPGFVEEQRGAGIDGRGLSNDPTRYWHPTTDASLLARELGKHLIAHVAPGQPRRRSRRH